MFDRWLCRWCRVILPRLNMPRSGGGRVQSRCQFPSPWRRSAGLIAWRYCRRSPEPDGHGEISRRLSSRENFDLPRLYRGGSRPATRDLLRIVRPSRTPSQLVSSTCSQTERSYSLHATLTLRALCCLWLSAVRAPTEPLLHMWCYGLVISKIRLRSINQWLNVRIFYSQKTAGNTTATKEKTGHVRITIIHGFG